MSLHNTTAPGGGGNTIDFKVGVFRPVYYPDRVSVSKKRNLNTEDAVCDGQYVTDNGGENRKIHVKGVVLQDNLSQFEALVDSGIPHDLLCEQGEWEVYVEDSKVEGPRAWDGAEHSWWFDYTLDLVSSGRDEVGDDTGGIVQESTGVARGVDTGGLLEDNQ